MKVYQYVLDPGILGVGHFPGDTPFPNEAVPPQGHKKFRFGRIVTLDRQHTESHILGSRNKVDGNQLGSVLERLEAAMEEKQR